MLTPGGFYILFFGLAALAVGAVAGVGFILSEWLQWLLFSVNRNPFTAGFSRTVVGLDQDP